MTRIPGTTARYLIRDDTLFVFCQGTSSEDRWWRNLLLRRVQWRRFRVNRADLSEALDIHVALPKEGYRSKQIAGFSRGAGPAAILREMIGGTLFLYAPKRAGNIAFVKAWATIAQAYRFDIIPLLPLWYAGWRCDWREYLLPWVAHRKAAQDAAHWRHEIGG